MAFRHLGPNNNFVSPSSATIKEHATLMLHCFFEIKYHIVVEEYHVVVGYGVSATMKNGGE